MFNKTIKITTLIFLFIVLPGTMTGYAQCTITQNSENSMLAYKYVGQSFTACSSGLLKSVKIKLGENISNATLKLYDGEGTSGTLLYQTSLNGTTYAGEKTWDLHKRLINLTEGNQYTIMLFSLSEVNLSCSSSNVYVDGVSYGGQTSPVSQQTTKDLFFELEIATEPLLYVNINNNAGTYDGKSWATAYKYLQDALNHPYLIPGYEIWIAEGVYYPDEDDANINGDNASNNDRDEAFVMHTGVKLYGGFQGTETDLSQRDPGNNLTIISGDITQNDENSDGNFIAESYTDQYLYSNSYHLFEGESHNGTAILMDTHIDGFVITAGRATGSYTNSKGGGVYFSVSGYDQDYNPVFENCHFSGNIAQIGGAIYIESSSLSARNPEIYNCTFQGNRAEESDKGGGAIYIEATSQTCNPSLTNCVFYDNSAIYNGGAIYLISYNSTNTLNPDFINCTFSENTAGNRGGAMYSFKYSSGPCSPSIVNSIFYGNTASSYHEIANSYATPQISYCIIEGSNGSGSSWSSSLGTDGGNNLDVNPGFVSASTGDLRILGTSPAADVGNNTANDFTTDIRGGIYTRKLKKTNHNISGTIDVGAYEYYESLDPYIRPIFVKADASGNNNGSSWEDAYEYLQDALYDPNLSDEYEIWVASGVYYPDEDDNSIHGDNVTDNDRETQFVLVEGVEMYGGFSGNETDRAQRDIVNNPTILSGDIDNNDSNSDKNNIAESTSDIYSNNSYHVVFADGSSTDISEETLLDGFIITAGRANGTGDNKDFGGGIFCYGSDGCWNYGPESNPSVQNCTFSGNYGKNGGGAIYADGNCGESSPIITNCLFHGNYGKYGGGLYVYGDNGSIKSEPEITNCTFTANSSQIGGGIYAKYSTAYTITNSIIYNNSSTSYSPNIYNSYSSPQTSYSLIQGSGGSSSWSSSFGNDLGNNIDTDPLFAVPEYYDYRITGVSPCLDAGTNTACDQGTDVRGIDYSRKLNKDNGLSGTIDMGVYEYLHGSDPKPGIIYVDADATGSNNGSSWQDAYKYLQDALAIAYVGDSIWVASGVYYPDEDDALVNGDNATDNNTSSRFNLLYKVKMWGGFSGNETSLTQRDLSSNPTILSGDIDKNDSNLDGNYIAECTDSIVGNNCIHVLYFSSSTKSITSETLVDGFTITAGKASSNYGGGLYNSCGGLITANPRIHNCKFIGNFAKSGGGAIYNYSSANGGHADIEIINCTFSGNKSSESNGGAFYNFAWNGTTNFKIINCSFSNNYAKFNGGAIGNRFYPTSLSCSPVIKNCVFSGDTALNSNNEIYNQDNVALYVSYSLVQGSGGSTNWGSLYGTDAGNNIDADAYFVDPANNDLRLICGSQAVDAGINSANTLSKDILGNLRIQDGTIDMGAYEGCLLINPPTLITDDITSFDALFATLGGNVTADGGATVTARGVVYSSTNTNPKIGDTDVIQIVIGDGTGSFYQLVNGLSPETTYHAQAYATNAGGTNYGGVKSFTTVEATPYYMAKSDGNWSNLNTWHTNYTGGADPDDYNTAATEAPDAENSDGIIINANVSLDVDVSIDQATITADNTLSVNAAQILIIINGDGDDLSGEGTLINNGTVLVEAATASIQDLKLNSGSSLSETGNAVFTVNGDLYKKGSLNIQTGSQFILMDDIKNMNGDTKLSVGSVQGVYISGDLEVEQ